MKCLTSLIAQAILRLYMTILEKKDEKKLPYMKKLIAYKKGDNKYFIAILYEQSLISESKNIIIHINLNQSSNCCLYSLKTQI